MATKRRKIAPRKIDQRVPQWARDLLAGRLPTAEEDKDAFVDWRFFREHVPGLPQADTTEGHALIRAAKEVKDAHET